MSLIVSDSMSKQKDDFFFFSVLLNQKDKLLRSRWALVRSVRVLYCQSHLAYFHDLGPPNSQVF